MLGGGDQRGVLEMAAEDIFNEISESTSRDFLLRVSFVEIYNEKIKDLLSETSREVAIREDPRKGVYCDAIEIIITDYESIIKALKKGTVHSLICDVARSPTTQHAELKCLIFIFRHIKESG